MVSDSSMYIALDLTVCLADSDDVVEKRPRIPGVRAVDVDEEEIEEIRAPALKKTRDVDHFFGQPKRVAGFPALMRVCLACS